MIYFISDLHFGHANIIKMCNRPFSTVDKMDSILLENWNVRVTNHDTVYILGDMFFRNKKKPEEYISQLKGKKHLIRGNHDESWLKKCNPNELFSSIENLSFISDGKHRITLCHYPLMSWPHMNTNGYMVFGHIHANTNADYWSLIAKSNLMLNAGVDVNGYKPVTFEEMVENNANFKMKVAERKMYEENHIALENLRKRASDLMLDE